MSIRSLPDQFFRKTVNNLVHSPNTKNAQVNYNEARRYKYDFVYLKAQDQDFVKCSCLIDGSRKWC